MNDRTSQLGGIFEVVMSTRVEELRFSSKMAFFLRLII
jgi:hypothetical protein